MKVRCYKRHDAHCESCNDTELVEDPSLVCGRYVCDQCCGAGRYLSGCDGEVECAKCGQTGLQVEPSPCYSCDRSPACKRCRGEGRVTNVRGNCLSCAGTGVRDGQPCQYCGATRWLPGELRLYHCHHCGVIEAHPSLRECVACKREKRYGFWHIELLTGRDLP